MILRKNDCSIFKFYHQSYAFGINTIFQSLTLKDFNGRILVLKLIKNETFFS